MSGPSEVVRAAGGVVTRGGEIAVVHREKYDDWSLPKGKLDPDESAEAAALREVEEETGLRCRLGRHLGRTEYLDRKGRPKVVDYWLMSVAQARDFEPNDEIDELRWLPPREAADLLTYPFDRDLVADLTDD
jgi:8-oxo-dGTP pyrophosphatase MutT (NUDIX family)